MIHIYNNENSYGMVAILLHWLIAIGLVALFASGLWMTSLDYYHPWYNRAPALHISFGILVALLVVARMLWSLFSRHPQPLTTGLAALAATAVHLLLHLLPLLIALSGYLVVTAEGQGVAVFSLFELPPLLEASSERADSAGEFHLWFAWGLMFFSLVHAMAAFYHHFMLHDTVLVRMFAQQHTPRGE